MAIQPVEWILVIFYGRSAHRATYGRLKNDTKYTKDYIQLSRKKEFLETASRLFSATEGATSVPLTYQWPLGTTAGAFVLKSADRPHLKWETNLGAPRVWKMALDPREDTAETLPGNPLHSDFDSAEKEFSLLETRGAGQPYLIAVKLRDESNKLHLRAYLGNPIEKFAWADIARAPEEVRSLAADTSHDSALSWKIFQSGGVPPSRRVRDVLLQLAEVANPLSTIDELDIDTKRALVNYLKHPGYGLFFDPIRNHDAWLQAAQISKIDVALCDEILATLERQLTLALHDDSTAEGMDIDFDQVSFFRNQIQAKKFDVPDSIATIKTRGSAQKAFADAVKSNYGMRCAITGIETREFLVASHIVPWSSDREIRLDPQNGICLSLTVDRAFECGYLIIEDNLSVRVDLERIGSDNSLRSQLEQYDGTRLSVPTKGEPRIEYLQRRRALIAAKDRPHSP